jgi:hypothetical protein
MKKIICLLFGHRWERIYETIKHSYCAYEKGYYKQEKCCRCGKNRIFID